MIMMAEATRMVMKSHSYFRTKMLYLTNNEYKDYDIKGYKVTTNKTLKNDSPTSGKSAHHESKKIYIEIENNDIFT